MTDTKTIGILLASFGSAATAEEVPAYLARVRGGREAPPDLIAEFQRRYKVVGGSPLIRITREQAAALERLLNTSAKPGERYRTTVGMRYSAPWLADGLKELSAAGARRIVVVLLSAQYSPLFMGGYHRAVDETLPLLPAGTQVTVSGPWHDEPLLIKSMAKRVREALGSFPAAERDHLPIILTVHSLPQAMVEREPDYLAQIRSTGEALVRELRLPKDRWQQAYQSAGHSPEPWLKPDFKELLPGLRAQGHRSVLVVPLQFLADHLETLYDVDTAGGEEAASEGMRMVRSPALNAMPEFIEALAAVVKRELTRYNVKVAGK